ncbi:NAD(P)H-hydrate dehydratase [Umboniibacter marinipuniceus]|uniref:Bifunctional NAD(P)H-hydrate repair enzyme n=1 Tax=Umboniibacter marinipuniceus TaxID=569599 RepID=A0A3M0ATK6_9GAMM|nr:NAD(P)H-hydrate dehydratase [Umboniibacter marinipuniceus]RMA82262.1 NAD(P)H-hydrate epimerase [Umboniibacter marinipuniceus]
MLHWQPSLSCSQVKALDRDFQQTECMPGYQLMKRAAHHCVELIQSHFNPRHCTVLCGGGNNGGDGWQIAAELQATGWSVNVLSSVDPQTLSGDARLAFDAASSAKVCWGRWTNGIQIEADLLVDALIGIGFKPPLTADLKQLINAVSETGIPVLAVDCPSGLNVDTGDAQHALPAVLTATFLALKPGLLTGDGKAASGNVVSFNLGCHARFLSSYHSDVQLLTEVDALPARSLNHFKHQAGHVLTFGGAQQTAGAAMLTAEAALFSGAGLVTLATDEPGQMAINARRPEVMVCRHQAVPSVATASVVAVGPGLAASDKAALDLCLQLTCPAVLDAGALRVLAANPKYSERWVLTPHTGEAAALLRESSVAVNADRIGSAKRIQQQFGGVVVLKGPGTIVCGPDRCIINSTGNAALGVAGSGDILTGVIAALQAQGLSPFDAAAAGVYWHGRAADLWREKHGERGLSVSELLVLIRAQINGVESGTCG